MTRLDVILLARLVLAISAVTLTSSCAQDREDEIAANTAAETAAPSISSAYVAEEYLLLGNATRGAGEPMIAVDPANPDNIVVVAMGNLQQLHGKPASQGSTGAYHLVVGSTINWLAVTNDGGISWSIGELPILSGKFTRCPDALADVTKDGVFIAGCEPRETESVGDHFGMSAYMMSKDKGRSWGPVVPMISDYALDRFAPGLVPVTGGFPAGSPDRVATHSPWDRPFTYIDDSSGVIYGVAEGGWTTTGAPPGDKRWQAYITASTDGGTSFGTIYSWDSPEYPQLSRGIGTAAAHGVVAVTYVASSTPSAAKCPCVVLGLSRDQGKTFEYHVLDQYVVQAPERGQRMGSGGHIDIAADPTTAGRFAMLKYTDAEYSVAVSEDFGSTWSDFVRAGSTPDALHFTKPAFEFSRNGVVGLLWRAIYADDSYDVWSAVSRDGGRTFSQSLKISHARSPSFDVLRNAGLFGDDIQDLAMDKENIHFVWGDSRAGFQGVWYGRVPISAYAL